MTIEQLRAIITKLGGDDKVLGIQFNGTAGYQMFGDEIIFNLNEMYHEASDSLVYKKELWNGEKYQKVTIVKPLSTIYSIIGIDDVNNPDSYVRFDPGILFG